MYKGNANNRECEETAVVGTLSDLDDLAVVIEWGVAMGPGSVEWTEMESRLFNEVEEWEKLHEETLVALLPNTPRKYATGHYELFSEAMACTIAYTTALEMRHRIWQTGYCSRSGTALSAARRDLKDYCRYVISQLCSLKASESRRNLEKR